MRCFLASTKRFLCETEGATMVEYGLMLGLIMLAAIGAASLLTNPVNGLFQSLVNAWP